MGKRKFILTASIIFVIGFGYCLYSAGKSKITEELPVEEMRSLPGTETISTETHRFIPDPEILPMEEIANHSTETAIDTEAHYYIPD